MQSRLHGLAVIDKEGMLAGQIAKIWRMIMKGSFGMEGSHLPVGDAIEPDIAIGSSSKTKRIGLKILGLPLEATRQVVQHAFHDEAPLPLIEKMGKKIEQAFVPLPVRSRSVGPPFFRST